MSGMATDSKGIGIQLYALRGIVKRLAEYKEIYRFTASNPISVSFSKTGENKIINPKIGDTFIYDKKLNKCFDEHRMCFFDITAVSEESREIKTISEFSVKDVGDMVRFEIRAHGNANTENNAFINQARLAGHKKSLPYKCAYVVCPRMVRFSELVIALNKHVQQKKVFVHATEYFVWIDIFCSNQSHNLEVEDIPNHDDLSKEMAKFRETLVYFDKIKDPTTLKRLWCVWELYSASKASEKTPLSVIFPLKIRVSEMLLLEFDILIETVLGLDPYDLESNNEEVALNLRGLMTSLPEGFNSVINSIKQNLCSWLTKLVIREYDTVQYLKTCVKVNTELYLDVGMYLVNISGSEENAKALYAKARPLVEQIDESERLFYECKLDLLDAKIFRRRDYSKGNIELLAAGSLTELAIKAGFKSFPPTLRDIERRDDGGTRGFLSINKIHRRKGAFFNSSETRTASKSNSNKNPSIMTGSFQTVGTASSTFLYTEISKSMQTSDSVHASSKHTQKYTDTRTNVDKFYDVYLHFLVLKKEYVQALQLTNFLLRNVEGVSEISSPDSLFGGNSAASLNFKYGREQFQSLNKVDNVQAPENYSNAFKNSGPVEVFAQRKFVLDKCAYYKALSFIDDSRKADNVTEINHIYQTLHNHFFKPNNTSPAKVSIKEPFVIGCTRRAAQVYFLLAQFLPEKKKQKVPADLLVEVGYEICRSLYGTEDKGRGEQTFEKYVSQLRDRIKKDCV